MNGTSVLREQQSYTESDKWLADENQALRRLVKGLRQENVGLLTKLASEAVLNDITISALNERYRPNCPQELLAI